MRCCSTSSARCRATASTVASETGGHPDMRILVTGAAGFIGSHLSQRLVERGDEVLGYDDLNPYYDPTLKQARLERLLPLPGFSFVKGGLEERGTLDRAFANFRPQRVVNLAAQAGVRYSLENPQAYIDSNIVGFTNVLEACRHGGVEIGRAHV